MIVKGILRFPLHTVHETNLIAICVYAQPSFSVNSIINKFCIEVHKHINAIDTCITNKHTYVYKRLYYHAQKTKNIQWFHLNCDLLLLWFNVVPFLYLLLPEIDLYTQKLFQFNFLSRFPRPSVCIGFHCKCV